MRSVEDATVEALYVVVDPDRPIAASEEIQFQRPREAREGTARERADAVHAAFLAWSAGARDDTPLVQWRSVTGAEEASVTRETADADLPVVVHNHNMDAGDALHAAVWQTHKPVLLAPMDWRPKSATFSHVAVALNDHQVATDAISGAMPLLHTADQVTALRIGHAADSTMRLCDALQAAGIEHSQRVVEPAAENKGVQIAEETQVIGADLLVARAYRHGPLVEWLMGGTTRHMLAAARVPLLLEHGDHR